jgi:hypothetical protein
MIWRNYVMPRDIFVSCTCDILHVWHDYSMHVCNVLQLTWLPSLFSLSLLTAISFLSSLPSFFSRSLSQRESERARERDREGRQQSIHSSILCTLITVLHYAFTAFWCAANRHMCRLWQTNPSHVPSTINLAVLYRDKLNEPRAGTAVKLNPTNPKSRQFEWASRWYSPSTKPSTLNSKPQTFYLVCVWGHQLIMSQRLLPSALALSTLLAALHAIPSFHAHAHVCQQIAVEAADCQSSIPKSLSLNP